MQLPVLIIASITTVLIEGKSFQVTSPEHFKAIVYVPLFLGGIWNGSILLKLLAHPRVMFALSVPCFAVLFFALRWNIVPPSAGAAAPVFGLIVGLSGSIILSRIPLLGSALANLGRKTLPVYVSHFLLLKMCIFFFANRDIVVLPGFGIWGVFLTASATLTLSLSLGRITDDFNATWLFALPAPFVKWVGTGLRPYSVRAGASGG